MTIRQGKQNKFSPKYYGPFEVIEKIGAVAYRLSLPPKFIMSFMSLNSRNAGVKGRPASQQPVVLPTCDQSGVLMIPTFDLSSLGQEQFKGKGLI